MDNIGLVLEGGGMRGLYTCGVLEFFLEKNLFFNYIIGVSAGACNAVSYISKQKGRNKKVNIDYCRSWKYMSLRNLLLKGSFIGMDYIFDEIPTEHVKFDFNEFYKSNCNFLVGVTDCNTGKPIYLTKNDCNGRFDALRATSSLPLICPVIQYKGFQLLDGGISDSIPIKKSISDGNSKNIIILTRDKQYRKSPIKYRNLIRFWYRKYPKLADALLNRYKAYNETLDYVDQLEEESKALVIRQSSGIKVGRLERKPEKLEKLFNQGYTDAENSYEKIVEFIKGV